jgi:hypothetical protein
MTKDNGSKDNREPTEGTLSPYDLLWAQIAERLAASGVLVTSRSEHPEWFPPQTTGAIFVPRIPRRRPSPSEAENTAAR